MLPKISDSEWRVLKLLWEKSPRTANEIVEALEGQIDWNHRTIRTLINRLLRKKALRFNKKGREYLYYPTVIEEEYLQAERKSFLSRVYNGALQPMLAAFLEETDLSPEEIEELENLLKQKRSSE
jgi:BlaI family penicillinase repressor